MHPDDLEPHPQYQIIVPQMTPDEFEAFVDDIADRDIKTPIEVHGRIILDGVHRWRAAKELGLSEIPTIEANLDPESDEDTLTYICRSMVMRRQLTDDQRAVSAALYAKENPKQRGRPRKNADGGQDKGAIYEIAAKLFNASISKTRKASDLLKQDSNVARQVHRGTISLSKAQAKVRAKKQKEKPKPMTTKEIKQKIVKESDEPAVIPRTDPVLVEREECARLVEKFAEDRQLEESTKQILFEVAQVIRERQ